MYKLEEIVSTCEKLGFKQETTMLFVASLPKKRSTAQNKALHVLFKQMADKLSEKGFTFAYKGLKRDIECIYTPSIVKDFVWRPLQEAMTEKESTTQISTDDINLIFEVLGKWFAEQEIIIQFPSREELEN